MSDSVVLVFAEARKGNGGELYEARQRLSRFFPLAFLVGLFLVCLIEITATEFAFEEFIGSVRVVN